MQLNTCSASFVLVTLRATSPACVCRKNTRERRSGTASRRGLTGSGSHARSLAPPQKVLVREVRRIPVRGDRSAARGETVMDSCKYCRRRTSAREGVCVCSYDLKEGERAHIRAPGRGSTDVVSSLLTRSMRDIICQPRQQVRTSTEFPKLLESYSFVGSRLNAHVFALLRLSR